MQKIIRVNLSGQLPRQTDIYTGEESIQFDNRHPIFKTLMKLEFEDVLRNFNSQISH